MASNDPILNLADEISEWLSQAPVFSDIEEYASHVPEERVETLEWIARNYLRGLTQRKKSELSKLFPELYSKKTELQQLDALRLFSQYSVASVVANLRQDDAALAVPTDLEPSITTWAQTYVGEWDSAVLLSTVFTYQRRVVYGKTLVALSPSITEIADWRKAIEELYLEDGKSFEQGGFLDQHGARRMAEALKALKFLPDQFIERVVSPSGDVQRFHLLDDMSSVFSLAEALGEKYIYEDPETFYLAIWRQLKLALEEELLAKAEAERLAESRKEQPLEEFFTWLGKVWSVEAIQGGVVPPVIASYLETLDPKGAKTFDELFTTFLENSAMVSMVISPIEPLAFVATLKSLTNSSEVSGFARDMEAEVTDLTFKPLARNLVMMSQSIFDQLKRRVQQIPPSSIQ